MTEPREIRLKRLAMRSWRRGMREMDIVLGPYADARLAEMDGPALDAWEALLDENDQDLLAWLLGHRAVPAVHAPLIDALAASVAARRTG